MTSIETTYQVKTFAIIFPLQGTVIANAFDAGIARAYAKLDAIIKDERAIPVDRPRLDKVISEWDLKTITPIRRTLVDRLKRRTRTVTSWSRRTWDGFDPSANRVTLYLSCRAIMGLDPVHYERLKDRQLNPVGEIVIFDPLRDTFDHSPTEDKD